jgi:phosphoglucosamine mutase
MTRQLFGTDGMRGVAGQFPLDPPTIHALGAALGQWCSHRKQNAQVLIGMDTRESGPWIAAQAAGGLARFGVRARNAGLITTPGVAFLTRTGDFEAGVMISASHNPYRDNGIKIFDHSGFKLPDHAELNLEAALFELLNQGLQPAPADIHAEHQWDEAYLDFLAATFPHSLHGMKIVLDCGHGAASFLAPKLLQRLGAHVIAIGCSPNGVNINDGCGSLHIGVLRAEILQHQAEAGFAFDGDADRCIAVSSSGRIIDGDRTLLICAHRLLQLGRLTSNSGPVVVATVMSNLGLEKALAEINTALVRTPVGDKYVLEEMVRLGAPIGGEQSGHVIFRDLATTGDGMLTALRLLDAMAASQKGLDQLAASMRDYPQKLVNLRVTRKKPIAEMPEVVRQIQLAEHLLAGNGRVVVRFSGTEPLARVMIEGPTTGVVDSLCERIAQAIRAELST